MILTIGMIVKNEEKYLEKCLNAIRPILDNVDSELIITDTGSTDRTVEIAEKYADKVLHFEWINDFSAARNTVFSVAQGEWFMVLDADDIFVSCDDIIDFFNSGKYKNYNSATYINRNLKEGGIGSDLTAARMTRILDNTRYVGNIHERLNTFGSPIKNLSDIAEHYGYVYNDDSERNIKFERNFALLLKKYEQDKDNNPMIYAEMYDTLVLGFRQSEADLYLEKGIEWCISHNHPVLLLLYCKKARHLLFESHNIEALRVCSDYFNTSIEIRPSSVVSDAEIYAVRSTALYRLEKYDEACDALTSYFKIYDDIKNERLKTRDRLFGSLSLASDSNFISFIGQFLVCSLNLKKYDYAAEILSELPIYKYTDYKDDLDSVIELEAALLENVDIKYLDAFCDMLDEYGRNKLKKSFEDKVSEKTYSADDIALTIGMIVKNEEARLEKCLDSIIPLLEGVRCELIITDTGSADRTVEIAGKYTDKILHFDWCDDFSAARNTAFEIAKGNWFMFVDADDVFASCDGLIEFFNSDESDKYGSASFTYRNIRSEDKQEYIDQYVIRIVRRLPQTKFAGRIHEVLDPMPEPIKALDTIVEHYGYFYDNNNNAAAKMQRNERILLKELEDTPISDQKSVLLYYYLYEELRDEESEKAKEYLDTGIEKAYSLKSETIIPLIHEKSRIYLSLGDYSAVLKLCDEYFALAPEMRAGEICADTEMYAAKAVALMQSERYDEAVKAFREFFRLFDLVNSGQLITGDRYIYLPALSGDGNLTNMIARFMDCCERNGSTSDIESFLDTFQIPRYIAAERQADLFSCVGILMRSDMDISPLLFGDDRQIALTAVLCCENIQGFYDTAGAYSLQHIKEQDKLNNAALLYEIIINKALKDKIAIDTLMQRFIEIGALYTGEPFQGLIKLSRVIGQSDAERRSGRYRECLALLKEALNDFPNSAIMIRGYIDLVSSDLNSAGKPTLSPEMEKLATMLKSNVKQMIAAGNYDTAKKYLDEYAKILPADPEIEILKNMIK